MAHRVTQLVRLVMILSISLVMVGGSGSDAVGQAPAKPETKIAPPETVQKDRKIIQLRSEKALMELRAITAEKQLIQQRFAALLEREEELRAELNRHEAEMQKLKIVPSASVQGKNPK